MSAYHSRVWKIGASAIVLGATVCLFALTSRDDQATSLFGRWSPQSAVVSAPAMGVNAAKRLHSLFQQQRWAHMFSQAAEQRKELAEALSPLTFRNGRYPTNVISEMGRNEQLRATAFNQAHTIPRRERPSASPRSWKQTQLSSIPYAISSSEHHPADFNVHQTYDYLPAPEGYGVSDEDAAKMWRENQRDYLERNPSTTTYPAVPVVFREDPDGGHPAANSYSDDYVEGSSASESPTWFQSSKTQLLRDGRNAGGNDPVRSSGIHRVHTQESRNDDMASSRERQPERMGLHSDDAEARAKFNHHKESSFKAERSDEKQVKRPAHVDAAIAALYKWEREHGVDDKKAWEHEDSSKEHGHAPLKEGRTDSNSEDMFEIRKALSDIRDFEDKTERNTESLKSQIKDLAVKEREVEHHIRTGLLQNRKDLAAQRLQQKKIAELAQSRDDASPSFYHVQSTESLLQKMPKTKQESPAKLSSIVRSERVDENHRQVDDPSRAAKIRKSSSNDDDQEKSHIKIPKEVIRQADQLIKQKAVQEMAKEDERSIEDDTNFIFAGMDKEEEGHSSASGGFTRLHSIEKSILEKLIQKHESADKKREAAERIKQAALPKAAASTPSESPHKPPKAVLSKDKPAPAADNVQSRAMEFVKAFDKIGGHAEHSKLFDPVDRDAWL
eukprot:762518-Hanusia_phi.AAC.1